jgi:hypothetical protein
MKQGLGSLMEVFVFSVLLYGGFLMLIPIISRVYIGILEVEFRFSYIYLVF